MPDYKEVLQEAYDRIWNSSKENLLNNDVSTDINLSNIEDDKRLGLTVLIPLGDIFLKVINQLKEIEPKQYFYPATDTHITVIDFIGASEDFVFDEKQVKVYKKVLDAMLKDFSKFNIEFKGLTASKGAVIVQGFFDDALQKLREKLRQEVNKQGIELKERYKVETAHATIMRFKKKLQNPEALANKIEKMRNIDLGTFEVKKILFVLHDWYNLKGKTKILAEYELC
jgi:2'-5' RNA ligase